MSLNILHLEDDTDLLEDTTELFTRTGMTVFSASTVEEGLQLLATIGHIDVCLLDMNLGKGSTGVDFGMELRRRPHFQRNPPAFLIYSGYDYASFYQQAIRLVVAAYLQKGDYQAFDLIPPLRALSLWGSVNWERCSVLEAAAELTNQSTALPEALLGFLEHMLQPHLNRLFNNAAFMLAEIAGEPIFLHQGETIRAAHSLAAMLDEQTLGGIVNGTVSEISEKYVWDDRISGSFSGNEDQLSMVCLCDEPLIKLSLGFANHAHPDANGPTDNPKELTASLRDYYQQGLIAGLLRFMDYFEANKQGYRRSAAASARAMGGQIQDWAQELGGKVDDGAYPAPLGEMIRLGKDLRQNSSLLDALETAQPSPVPVVSEEGEKENNELEKMAKTVWHELSEIYDHLTSLHIDGDEFTLAPAATEYFMHALQEIFLAFSDEAQNSGSLVSIQIHVQTGQRFNRITIKDQGDRLGSLTRRFSLHGDALNAFGNRHFYLAGELMAALGGYLLDETNLLPTDSGNQFVLCLPLSTQRDHLVCV